MNILQKLSKTEKILFVTISLLTFAVLANAVAVSNSVSPSYADESSGSSEASGSGTESSGSSEEDSTPSIDEASTPSVDEVSTPSVDEASTPSVDEVSTPSVDEVSTPSIGSEVSVEEESVSSGIDIDNFVDGEVIHIGDDVAIVFEDEKLFFLIPVKIEKKLLLDETGVVLDVQQSLFSRILSWFSF